MTDTTSNDNSDSMYDRFVRSSRIDADNWRDPQHDLEALRLASPAERRRMEQFLIQRGIRHIIDVEALALLDTPPAKAALMAAFRSGSNAIRAAVARLVPEVIQEHERQSELISRIAVCDAYDGLDLTLDQIQATHPPEVIAAMLKRIAQDPGVAAVHFVALLYFMYGIAEEPFDWSHRPFFLRFNAGDEIDREDAFRELCQNISQDFNPYAGFFPKG